MRTEQTQPFMQGFREGFAAYLSVLFAPSKPPPRPRPDLVHQAWQDVGDALRTAMQTEASGYAKEPTPQDRADSPTP